MIHERMHRWLPQIAAMAQAQLGTFVAEISVAERHTSPSS